MACDVFVHLSTVVLLCEWYIPYLRYSTARGTSYNAQYILGGLAQHTSFSVTKPPNHQTHRFQIFFRLLPVLPIISLVNSHCRIIITSWHN
jgi:hypothetical protein